MTTEQKAKAYDEAIKKLRSLHDDYDTISTLIDIKEELEEIFPELAESEDERIVEIIKHCIESRYLHTSTIKGISQKECFAWLEKQTNIIPNECVFRPVAGCNIESAAKQAIKQQGVLAKEVVLAFNGAYIPVGGKAADIIVNEYNSWLEKQGETSDQIHYWTEEEIEPIISDYLRGAEHYGGMIGRLRCLKPKSLEKQGKSYTKSDVDDAYLKGISDAENELEKQVKSKEYTFKSLPRLLDMIEPSDRAKAYCQKLIGSLVREGYNTDAKIIDGVLKGWNGEDVPMAVMDEKQGEIDNCPLECSTNTIMTDSKKTQVEPKFKVGDWIAKGNVKAQIIGTEDAKYCFDGYKIRCSTIDKNYHLWTIQDAKDGDVLYHKAENGIEYIVMSKGLNENNNIDSYFRYNSINGFGIDIPSVLSAECDSITPATKEQRDLLFQKMKEAGYEWNAELKELKKKSQRMISAEAKEALWSDKYEGLTDFERTLADVCIGWIGEELGWEQYIKDNADVLLKIAIKKFNSVQEKPTWSEEDEEMLDGIILRCEKYGHQEQINWLKSIKQRIKGE